MDSHIFKVLIIIVITSLLGLLYYFINVNKLENKLETYFENKIEKYENVNNVHPACKDNLTDIDYLKHMIPHHQVAVDISIMLQKISKWDQMQDLLRKLIWIQKYEIMLMNEMLHSLPDNISSNNEMYKYYQTVVASYTEPNKVGLINVYCDPNFFNPKEHMKHLQHMKLNDEMYIKHMIPHHQVAVDMSKKLLKHTTNDFMISLAYRIIRSQEAEIVLLKDMLNSINKFSSNLIN